MLGMKSRVTYDTKHPVITRTDTLMKLTNPTISINENTPTVTTRQYWAYGVYSHMNLKILGIRSTFQCSSCNLSIEMWSVFLGSLSLCRSRLHRPSTVYSQLPSPTSLHILYYVGVLPSDVKPCPKYKVEKYSHFQRIECSIFL